MVNKKQIVEFLKIARANSWPDNTSPVSRLGLYGFEETHFIKGEWEFYDLFGGAVSDIGFFGISYKKEAVWGVSYRGGVINSNLDSNEVFSFLIEALKVPSDDDELPLRGPTYYQRPSGQWVYRYHRDGEFYSFIAVEQILFDNEVVYERTLIGGSFGHCLYGQAVPLYWQLFN